MPCSEPRTDLGCNGEWRKGALHLSEQQGQTLVPVLRTKGLPTSLVHDSRAWKSCRWSCNMRGTLSIRSITPHPLNQYQVLSSF